jgi:protein N-terminal amidase
MDLNAQPPHSWTTRDGPFELADHCLAENSNILVLLNAWLESGEQPQDEYDMHTMNFWAERLRPLWQEAGGESMHETLVVVCNRGGSENGLNASRISHFRLTLVFLGKTFAGSSAVFHMRQGRGKAGVLRAALGREEEDVMLWDSSA